MCDKEMKMLFNKIKDSDFEAIKIIQKNTQYNGSEWSRIYLKAWKFFDWDNMEIATKNDIIFIRFVVGVDIEFFKQFNHIYLPPICTIDKAEEGINLAMAQAKLDCEIFAMIGVPQEYIDACKDPLFTYQENINQSEYLYLTSDLVEFIGKKYHQKRNHISAFDRLYPNYVFRPYKKEDRCSVEKLLMKWESKKPEEYIEEDEQEEYYAIERSLDMAFDENVYPYVLEIDGKIVGFTLGEITPSNVGIIHIEKADIEYNGIYSKLVNLYAKEVLSNTRLINRQEDMGDEGLRQSKLSYKPIGYSFKYFLKY